MTRLTSVIALGASWMVATGACGASPETVISAKFDAVNRHAIPDIVAFYAPAAVLTASDFCAPRHGKADVQRTYEAIFAAVPDIRADVVEIVKQDKRVAARVILRSRERKFELPIMNFFTVEKGQIVRDDGIFDTGGRPCRS